MPIAQYTNMFKKPVLSISRTIPTPKRIGELRYWLKMCHVHIKELPWPIAESEQSADRSIGSDGWFVVNTDVDIRWIKFNLENRVGEKAHLLIDRSVKM